MDSKVFDFVVDAVRKDELRKYEDERKKDAKHYNGFYAEKKAGELVESCKKQATRCREREKYYTTELEVAEKELRDKGITMQAVDPNTGFSYVNTGNICSGAMTGVSPHNIPKFQPQIDQGMLGAVERAKTKMVEHRSRAEVYEKQARAFAINPDFLVRLSVDDIYYFRLGE